MSKNTVGTEFNDIPFGTWIALANKLGGRTVVDDILDGTKKATIEEVVPLVFDRNGRCIPRGLNSSPADPCLTYRLIQPTISYADRLERLIHAFPEQSTFCTVREFEQEVGAICKMLKDEMRFKNWAKGIWLPIIIPQVTSENYGEALESIFFAAVRTAYSKEFSERQYIDTIKGGLAGWVDVVHRSHKRLVDKMRKGPVIGIYLPNALQGFSIDEAHTYAESLPEFFHLSGGYDLATAMVAYPDVLARDEYTPGYNMAGVQFSESQRFFYFQSVKGKLWIDERYGFSDGAHSAGLFIAR